MGMFSAEAHVSYGAVENFSETVISFFRLLESNQTQVLNELDDARSEIETLANELYEQKRQCDSLYEEIQHRRRDIEHRIADLRNRLKNTSQYTEREEKQSDGSAKVTKKPNPEYQNLQKEIRGEESRLSKIKDLSWKVYNKKSEIARDADYVKSAVSEVQAVASKMKTAFDDMTRKTQQAKYALENTLETISNYTGVDIKQ